MALVAALLAGFLLLTYGMTTVFMADTETRIGSADRAGREALYAADAGAQAVIAEIARAGTWQPPLDGQTSTILFDGTLVAPVLASSPVDLTARTSSLQAATDAAPAGGDRSEWHLYAWGPASMLLSSSASIGSFYVAVWFADDSGDGDGNPSFDANGIVIVHAESYGPGGLMRVVECVVSRAPATGSRPVLLSWRELRPI
jgi:hypothetical protein